MHSASLEKLGINLRGKYSGIIKTKCPKCGDVKGHEKRKDLSVSITEGWYKCHSASCDFKGKVFNKKYEAPAPELKSKITDRARKLIGARNIDESTAKSLGIGVNEKGNVQFDYYREGKLINYKVRWTNKDGSKGFSQHEKGEPIFFNLDSVKGKKKVIICEGEWDVASWASCGLIDYGIISVPNGAPNPGDDPGKKLECLKTCAEYLLDVEEFYLSCDFDDPGRWLEKSLIERLGDYKCLLVRLPEKYKDANDVFQDHNRTNAIKILKDSLIKAERVPVIGLAELDEDVEARIINHHKNGVEKGLFTGVSSMRGRFSWYNGELTLITGIPGHGKSTFARFLMLNSSITNQFKWACFPPEDMPEEYFYEDMAEMLVGKAISNMSRHELNTAIEYLREYFYVIKPEISKKVLLPSNEWINERIEVAKLKYGVNCYYKDPWNKISHQYTFREDQYLAEELSKEKFFATGYMSGLYVAHPHKLKPELASSGTYIPDPYDLAGGAMWYNMMDNIMAVAKITGSNDDEYEEAAHLSAVTVRVHKIKKQKIVGRPGDVLLQYNTDKNTYVPRGRETVRDSSLIDRMTSRFEEQADLFFDSGDDYQEEYGDIPF